MATDKDRRHIDREAELLRQKHEASAIAKANAEAAKTWTSTVVSSPPPIQDPK